MHVTYPPFISRYRAFAVHLYTSAEGFSAFDGGKSSDYAMCEPGLVFKHKVPSFQSSCLKHSPSATIFPLFRYTPQRLAVIITYCQMGEENLARLLSRAYHDTFHPGNGGVLTNNSVS